MDRVTERHSRVKQSKEKGVVVAKAAYDYLQLVRDVPPQYWVRLGSILVLTVLTATGCYNEASTNKGLDITPLTVSTVSQGETVDQKLKQTPFIVSPTATLVPSATIDYAATQASLQETATENAALAEALQATGTAMAQAPEVVTVVVTQKDEEEEQPIIPPTATVTPISSVTPRPTRTPPPDQQTSGDGAGDGDGNPPEGDEETPVAQVATPTLETRVSDVRTENLEYKSDTSSNLAQPEVNFVENDTDTGVDQLMFSQRKEFLRAAAEQAADGQNVKDSDFVVQFLTKPMENDNLSVSTYANWWFVEGEGRNWNAEAFEHYYSSEDVMRDVRVPMWHEGDLSGVAIETTGEKMYQGLLALSLQMELDYYQFQLGRYPTPNELQTFVADNDERIVAQADAWLAELVRLKPTVVQRVWFNRQAKPTAMDALNNTDAFKNHKLPNFETCVTRMNSATERQFQQETADTVNYIEDLEQETSGNDQTWKRADRREPISLFLTVQRQGGRVTRAVVDALRIANVGDKLNPDAKVYSDRESGRATGLFGRLINCLPGQGRGEVVNLTPTLTPFFEGQVIQLGPTEPAVQPTAKPGETAVPTPTPRPTETYLAPNEPTEEKPPLETEAATSTLIPTATETPRPTEQPATEPPATDPIVTNTPSI